MSSGRCIVTARVRLSTGVVAQTARCGCSTYHYGSIVMTTNWKLPIRGASALLLSLVLAGCASGPPAHTAELHQQIESASTASEHAALATYYDREAATARATAAEHRSRALRYPSTPPPRGSGSMRNHCNVIARNFDAIAAEYVGLAADHRAMAVQGKL